MPVNTVVMGIAGSRRLLQASRLEGGQRPSGERIWRREGLKVPAEGEATRTAVAQRWFVCVRLRGRRIATMCGATTSVSARTHDGRSVRLLNLIDEHTRESLPVRAQRRWSSSRVISALADVMVMKRECRNIFARTMGRSLSPKTYGTGWPTQEQKTLYIRAWLSVGERLLRELQL